MGCEPEGSRSRSRARTASLQARIPEADQFAFRDSRAYLDRKSSSAFIFDRLAYVDRLRAAGVDESQARAHAEAPDVALRDGIASKADIDRLATKLSGDIGRLEAKIETATAHLKVEILRWMVVTQLAVGGLLFAVLRFAK